MEADWKYACKRRAKYANDDKAIQSSIEKSCLSKISSDQITSDEKKVAISPNQILDEVTLALKNLPPPKTPVVPPITECDRLSSIQAIPGVKRLYLGFIEAQAAEKACLDAIKTAKDASRFQVNLAGVYLQQGRYGEATTLAQAAFKKSALNSGSILASMYSNGIGIPRSPEKVFSLLLNDAKRGSNKALEDLAGLILNGKDIEKAPTISLQLYKLAADNGSAWGAMQVGTMYLNGKDIEKDIPQAIKWLQPASEELPFALQPMALALLATPGSNQDEIRRMQAKLFEQMNHYANLGSLLAKNVTGSLYINGFGVQRDKEKGFSLYQEAYEGGYPGVLLPIGLSYLNGVGVAKNRDKAIEYFHKAADTGNPEAQVQLARIQKSQQ